MAGDPHDADHDGFSFFLSAPQTRESPSGKTKNHPSKAESEAKPLLQQIQSNCSISHLHFKEAAAIILQCLSQDLFEYIQECLRWGAKNSAVFSMCLISRTAQTSRQTCHLKNGSNQTSSLSLPPLFLFHYNPIYPPSLWQVLQPSVSLFIFLGFSTRSSCKETQFLHRHLFREIHISVIYRTGK